jgi:hypothetical protein
VTLRPRRPGRRTGAPWATGVVAVLVSGATLASVPPDPRDGRDEDRRRWSSLAVVRQADLDDARPAAPPKGVRRGAHRPARAVQVGLPTSTRRRGRQVLLAGQGRPPDDPARDG